LASASYDTSVRIWNLSHPDNNNSQVIRVQNEFVTDVEWSVNFENQLAFCCWDESVRVCNLTNF